MANKIVKNLSNQPLYFNLAGGRSLKIPARSQAEVDEADLNSGEMALQQSRGNIILVEAGAKSSGGGAGAAGVSHQPPADRVSPQPAGTAKDEEGGNH
jgi:hypothetical protein